MREYVSPLTVEIPTTGSLTDDVVSAVDEQPQAVLFSRRAKDDWVDVTAEQFRNEVVQVAKGLVASGVQPGDRVVLVSKTRYEWTLLDYAIWWAGAATVPVYETSSAEQIGWILEDSGATVAVVESADHLARVEEVRDRASDLKRVWQLDDGAIAALTEAGAAVSDADLEQRRGSVTPDDLATLIYTSGTTGRPKGCELTHGNFMFELGVAVDELDRLFDAEGASTLLFLPLAHVFARIIQVGCVKARVRLGHTADVSHLLDDLAAFQPTFILAVPRVFEKVFNSASQKAHSEGKGKIFDAAATTAIAYSRAQDNGKIRPLLRVQHALFDRLVYTKLRAALGGKTDYAVSGGAPLGERLAHFFRGIGLTVLEGYGLTETTAALTANLPDAQRIGSVGRPLQGTGVRVADDGELLFRGGQVFRRYWHNEPATADALDADGWFHTGDMGEIDDDGFVRITGRKKEILVTAGGKNVAPAPLEDAIRAHPLVSQCMVVGEAKPFVAALVTIDPEAFASWRDLHGKSGEVSDLNRDPDLLAEIQAAVNQANAGVSKAESIRKFVVLPVDWTEEGGQVTPTLKLKRAVVMREFSAEVEAVYT
ncbi:MAG: AMP-binding protein [Propionibacteriales bacterium]|nr:AMP-binding protein [Propionibacteriales bacterium]